MTTILLLLGSNLFMTAAWYWHLKFKHWPIAWVVALSWLIALPEYCLQVPGNRIGHGAFTAPQLKIIQEAISISVFIAFSILYLGETPKGADLLSFVLILSGIAVAMWGRMPAAPSVP